MLNGFARHRPVLSIVLLACIALAQLGCSGQEPGPDAPTPAAAEQPSAASRYEGKAVKHPSGPGDDRKAYVVQNGKKRWVVNASWFAANGYKFPDDVTEIPVADFEAIPTGDPIQ